mgnify:CR=1 FL=1
MGQWNLNFIFRRQKIFYPNGFHDLCKCGILLWYRAILRRRQQKSVWTDLFLPDVPFEEKEEFAIPFKEHGLDLISLIATTSMRELP